MPGRLIDELTRRGLLAPDQVTILLRHHERIGGATLDTSVLELDLVPENEVTSAMGAAYGLAVATSRDLSTPVDAQTTRIFPEQWAKRHSLAPVTLDAARRSLTMLVTAPPNLSLIAELGELLDLAIRPLLAPELRVRQRLSLLYEVPPPPRIAALLERTTGGPKPMTSRPKPPRGPMSFAEVTHRLGAATTRDAVVELALAYAQNEFELAALFTVRGPKILGWAAVGPGSERVEEIEIPRGARSSFWMSTSTEAHYLGPLEAQDAEHLAPLGRAPPRAALVVPIRVRGRIVALLYAENGPRAIPPRLAADAMVLATHVQLALEGVLVRAKRASIPPRPVPSRRPDDAKDAPIEARTEQAAAASETQAPPIPPRSRPLDSTISPVIVPVEQVSAWSPAPHMAGSEASLSSGVEPQVAVSDASRAIQPPTPAADEVPRRPSVSPLAAATLRASRPPPRRPSTPPEAVLPPITEPNGLEPERRRRNPVPAHLVSEPPGAPVAGSDRPEPAQSERQNGSSRPTRGRPSELPPFRLAEGEGSIRRPALDALSLFPRHVGEEATERVDVALHSIDEVDTLEEPGARKAPAAARGDEASTLEPPTLEEPTPPSSPPSSGELERRASPPLQVQTWTDSSVSGAWSDVSGAESFPVRPLSVESGPPVAAFDGETAPLIRPTGARLDELSRALRHIGEALSAPSSDLVQRRTAWPAHSGPADETVPELAPINPNVQAGLPAAAEEAQTPSEPAVLPTGPAAIPSPVAEPELAREPAEPLASVTSIDVPKVEPSSLPFNAPGSEPPSGVFASHPPRPAHLVNQTSDLTVPSGLPAIPAELAQVDDATLVEVLPAMRGVLEPDEPEHEPPSLSDLVGADAAPSPDDEPLRIRARVDSTLTRPEPWEGALITGSHRLPPPPPPPSQPPELTPSVRHGASPPPAAVLRDTAPRIESQPIGAVKPTTATRSLEISSLVDQISTELRPPKETLDRLFALGEEAIPKLVSKFPGRVRFDAMVVKRLPVIAECGPLVSLVARFGLAAHPSVSRLLDSADPLTRVWAVHFYGSVFVPEIVPLLSRRLHDDVEQVSIHTISALSVYRTTPEYRATLENLRMRLDAPSSETRARAIFALGGLRDPEAVPRLAEIFNEKEKRLTALAEDALAEITKQRLGPNTRRWLRWHGKNVNIPRTAWLIEGLKSDEAAIRKSAADELRAISGLDISFDATGPKKDRETARKAYLKWWLESRGD
ncbi:MAG: hypothetical protein HYV07_27975 [Deltaproteobacteria bacterium]|nr:hypothetical protein [Deltaproteobacteria bacterium]